ncbi:leucine-rich repeat receptor-like protein kinase TDR [Phalaenopsis equestris]|uniref:leucine-rich repeat receptor-like protein kinase TDR n=1 Tax=Phalaenopsis equestris TaxID=78828 RepID=UPI0009E62BD0|nr:leucine-rich repeat receptor-like protein kinase TDR [Phalaenopsis equestris]
MKSSPTLCIPIMRSPSSPTLSKGIHAPLASYTFHLPAFLIAVAMPLLSVTAATAAVALLVISSAAIPSNSLPLPLLALLSLKASLLDPLSSLSDWALPLNQNFSFSPPPWCLWSGVSCASSQVVSIDLSGNNLSGDPFPPELRLLSSSLVLLNLSANSFSGPIPSSSSLFHLRRLRSLDLSRNSFNASLPSSLSSLRRLTFLNLYSNSFSGSIPATLAALPLLEHLNLGGSFFSDLIPGEALVSLTGLRFLHLAGNLLTGSIPMCLGQLAILEHLEIGYNSYEGSLPPEIGRLRNLRYLDISSANLSGEIPPDIGSLTELQTLLLFKNRISGSVPPEISSLSGLKILDLSDNRLSGRIPAGISLLVNLTVLSLMNNEISGEIPPGIGEIASLEALLLWNNSLTGVLPPKLGSGGRLERVDVSSNSLSGTIPSSLCFGNRLVRLILFANCFESNIPSSLARCSSLWRIRIEDNHLTGSIPAGFGHLQNLTFFDLSSNNISGEIPPDLGTAPRLQFFNISGNPLRSILPNTIWRAPALQIFSASSCKLQGKIPNFASGCSNLYKLELSYNDLNGTIPADITDCLKLLSLKLNQNHLTGSIPPGLSNLPSITEVDLSLNFLTGSIPLAFDNCSTLENLNISFNGLAGPIPASVGIFRSLDPSSFAGNPSLCGSPLARPCIPNVERPPHQPAATAGPAIIWITTAALTTGLVVLIIGIRWFRSASRLKPPPWRLTAFQRLTFTADDVVEVVKSTAQIIGIGSSSTVYRGEMPNGEVIAIKKLSTAAVTKQRNKTECILPEVELVGAVRHRNIVRLLGYVSNGESTMLLYEYVPCGSLEELLHSSGGEGKGKTTLDWETRYRIAVGVAEGMSYLHHDSRPTIVHRDLKPSNILVDEEMEVRVADFGLAKWSTKTSLTGIVGSCGYIAPEYAYAVKVDERSDVYSFGVVLMEIVSGRRAVDGRGGVEEGKSHLVERVRRKVAEKGWEGVEEIFDGGIGIGCREVRDEMVMVLRVAMLCASERPMDRPSMRDVVSTLKAIRVVRKKVVDQD